MTAPTQMPCVCVIGQSIFRLFRALDEHDDESALRLFADSAVWQRPGGERVGAIAIARELKSRPRERRIVHLVTNLIVGSRGSYAEVTFSALAFADNSPRPGEASLMSLPLAIDAYQASLSPVSEGWLVGRLASTRLFSSGSP